MDNICLIPQVKIVLPKLLDMGLIFSVIYAELNNNINVILDPTCFHNNNNDPIIESHR